MVAVWPQALPRALQRFVRKTLEEHGFPLTVQIWSGFANAIVVNFGRRPNRSKQQDL